MSFTRLRYHIIFSTKKRQPLLTPGVREFLYPQFEAISEALGARTMAVGGVEDHVHTVTAIPPVLAISDFVRDLKSLSTTALKDKFPHLCEFSWQVGFGCFSLSPDDLANVISYVRNQPRHHEMNALWEKFERIERRPPET